MPIPPKSLNNSLIPININMRGLITITLGWGVERTVGSLAPQQATRQGRLH